MASSSGSTPARPFDAELRDTPSSRSKGVLMITPRPRKKREDERGNLWPRTKHNSGLVKRSIKMPVQASHVLNSRILSISTITSLPHCLDSARKATSEQAKVGKLNHSSPPCPHSRSLAEFRTILLLPLITGGLQKASCHSYTTTEGTTSQIQLHIQASIFIQSQSTCRPSPFPPPSCPLNSYNQPS